MKVIDFKDAKCRHCYKCVRYCEVKAISVQNEQAHIMEDHCIHCGQCLEVCPQNAKTFASRAKIIQIDIDPAEVNKNILIDTAIIGDVKAVLIILNRRLSQQNHEAWMQEIQDMKAKYPMTYHQERLSGPGLIEKIYELTEGDAIITTEVGQHQMWAAQYYKYERPRQFLTSGGLGTMGYGLGAAIGAKCGCPDKVVVNIAGDGCFRMNMNEIATATRSEIPVIEVVVNNHVLGMVRQWQKLFYENRFADTDPHRATDFVKVAEGFGVKALRINTNNDIDSVLKEAFEYQGPVLVDCRISPDSNVLPMIPPGGAHTDIIEKFN